MVSEMQSSQLVKVCRKITIFNLLQPIPAYKKICFSNDSCFLARLVSSIKLMTFNYLLFFRRSHLIHKPVQLVRLTTALLRTSQDNKRVPVKMKHLKYQYLSYHLKSLNIWKLLLNFSIQLRHNKWLF